MTMSGRLICLVGLSALMTVGVTNGAARKIKSFIPSATENATADGMAILNWIGGDNKTIVQVILTDFTANTSYDIAFAGTWGTAWGFNVLNTDDQGNAHFHTEVPGLDISSASVSIYLNGQTASEELRATGVE